MTAARMDDEERPVTGHAAHFLSRLDRVGAEQADLALRLYRSPGLLGAMLADPALPDAGRAPAPGASRIRGTPRAPRTGKAEPTRVAIAIGEGPHPPHVLVERSGRFVTCLGPGMGC